MVYAKKLACRLTDALMAQALSALSASPGARARYDAERASGIEHKPALRKLANRLAGIPHPLRRGNRLAAPGRPRLAQRRQELGAAASR
jgi:hypothetical protein